MMNRDEDNSVEDFYPGRLVMFKRAKGKSFWSVVLLASWSLAGVGAARCVVKKRCRCVRAPARPGPAHWQGKGARVEARVCVCSMSLFVGRYPVLCSRGRMRGILGAWGWVCPEPFRRTRFGDPGTVGLMWPFSVHCHYLVGGLRGDALAPPPPSAGASTPPPSPVWQRVSCHVCVVA